MKIVHRLLLVLTLLAPVALSADNGSNLWLPAAEQTAETTLEIAATEVAVTGRSVDFALNEQLPEEGFTIQGDATQLRIEGGSERALLYGAYRLVRDWKAGRMAATYAVSESPKYALRILNHWDNLNGTIERGYAGHSIFWEGGLSRPELWRQYGRANASVGINGTVLNNVNASPQVLDAEHLKRVQEIAAVLRPYGMRVYLVARRAGWAGKLRPAQPQGATMVARKGEGDLSPHSRLWRFSGQGQLRGTTRPAGFRSHARRRCQYVGRCAEALWRGGDVASLCL